MSSSKRPCPGEETSEYVAAVEKRQKTDQGYTLKTFKHWVFSRLPKLALLFQHSDTTESSVNGHDSLVSPARTIPAPERMTAWTFLATHKPCMTLTTRETTRKALTYRKRRSLQVRPRQSSITARPASPLLTMTSFLSSSKPGTSMANDQMDARLQNLSGRLQDLVKTGQAALKKPIDLES